MTPIPLKSMLGRALAAAIGAAALWVMTLHLAAPAAAQVQIPAELTVEEAIEIALRNNPGHMQVLNDVDAADAQVRASYGSFLPNVVLSSTFSSTYAEAESSFDEFGRPLAEPEPVITKRSQAGQSISLGSITLFDGGAQFRNVSVAKSQRNAAEAAIANGANTLRANVTRAYYQVVNGESRIELERELLEFARDRLELVQRQFEIAVVGQSDLLGAELEVARAEQAVADAESDVRAQRLNLLQLLGVGGEPPFTLVSDLPPIIDPAALSADALVARAVETHPAVLQSAATAAVSESQLSNQRGSRLPTISLNLPSYNWGAQESGLWDAWGRFGAPNNSFSFGVTASLPIFTGFTKSADIARSLEAAEDARQQTRQARLAVEKDLRDALIELERAHRSLLLAEQQATISRQRLELTQEEYQTGAIPFTTLQQIIESNSQSQRFLIDARFNFLSARVSLEERVGGPLQS